jgi:Holliday junction resolvase RusA-like endonuclease
MTDIRFFVKCEPRGKQRARVLRSGRSYTPKETVDLERLIAWECRRAMGGMKPLEGPLWLSVIAYFPYPKGWSKKQCRGIMYKTSKPDIDNMVKLVKDSLNGVAWIDDAQVAVLDCQKSYRTEQRGLHLKIGKLLELKDVPQSWRNEDDAT